MISARQAGTPFLRFGARRRLKLVRQVEAAECGLACLAMVAGWHGLDTDMTTLRRRFPISLKGATLEDRSFLDLLLDPLRAAGGRTLGS